MKQTVIDWLAEQFDSIVELYPSQFEKINRAIEQAKEMEKEQSQKYAEFAIHCDRNNLPILTFEDFIKL